MIFAWKIFSPFLAEGGGKCPSLLPVSYACLVPWSPISGLCYLGIWSSFFNKTSPVNRHTSDHTQNPLGSSVPRFNPSPTPCVTPVSVWWLFRAQSVSIRTTSVVEFIVRDVTEAEPGVAAGGRVLTAIRRLTTMIQRNQPNYTVQHAGHPSSYSPSSALFNRFIHSSIRSRTIMIIFE